MSIGDEGTVTSWLNHEQRDWAENDQGYKFGPLYYPGGIWVAVLKHPDRTIEVSISGPLYATFTFVKPIPPPARILPSHHRTVSRGDRMIAITWQHDLVKCYLDGQILGEVKATRLQISSLDLAIQSPAARVPIRVVSGLLDPLKTMLNFFSGVTTTDDQTTLWRILEYGLDVDKFSIQGINPGSVRLRIEGPKKACRLAKRYFVDIFAVLNGYSRRLAEAEVRTREANASKVEAQAKQEQLRVLEDMTRVARGLDAYFLERFPDIDATARWELISHHLRAPSETLSKILLPDYATVSVDEPSSAQ